MGFEHTGKQLNFFGITDANAERIVKQNSKPIMLVIGNPPYNASQLNENENNKNREYPEIDKRIKDTYAKYSAAQKTKVYDMYARFFRWASDRLDKDGLIAFITNSSFINARGFDGFRKSLQKEFGEIWIIDLGGNVREQDSGNVFGIKIGVAISFCVKDSNHKGSAKIYYKKLDFETAHEKLDFLSSNKIGNIDFEHVAPDKDNNWINVSSSDYEDLIPVIDKKSSKSIFSTVSYGVSTNRDEWVYDYSKSNLVNKSRFFIDEYNHEVDRWIKFKRDNKVVEIKAESNPIVDEFLHERNIIKWSKMIKRDKLRKEKKGTFSENDIQKSLYRPFVTQHLYFGYIPIDLKGQFGEFFANSQNKNVVMCFASYDRKKFALLASQYIVNLNLYGDPTVCAPIYLYDENGSKSENITDWAFGQFQKQYKDKKIAKENIFHYVYAVLHHPAYRLKYEINLKREFPRIPFYDGFWQWAEWGRKLMELHLNYESVQPYPLERGEREGKAAASDGVKMQPACRLIAHKEQGIIEVDTATTLRGVPAEAWEYRLGTYSALEWILERYKEKKPKDPTIAEKFNTYRFADYKEQVIELLMRVCTVSVETMKIVKEMPS